MRDPADSSAQSQLMAERYGVGRSRRKGPAIVALALVIVALLAFLAWSAWVHATTSVSGEVVSFDVRSEHRIDVTVQISRPAGKAAQCTLQAQAEDHSVVGEVVVSVAAASAAESEVTSIVKTDREATSASVSDCR